MEESMGVSVSPTKKRSDLVMVSFTDAIQSLIDNSQAKIARASWPEGWYGFILNDILSLRKPDGEEVNWMVSYGDIVGEDWLVL